MAKSSSTTNITEKDLKIAAQLWLDGFSWSEVAQTLNLDINSGTLNIMASKFITKEQRSQRQTTKKEQLCWSCARALPNKGCEWADKYEPVPGWEAIPTTRQQRGCAALHSYRITDCPKYYKGRTLPDEELKKLEKECG